MEDAVLENGVQGAHAVLPSDLFSLGVSAAVVGDPDLEDPHPETGGLGGQFRFDAETVFLDLDAREHLAAKDLVAAFHVREVDVREHVAEHGEEAVPDHVPIEDHPVRTRAGETGAEDDVGLAVDDGTDQPGKLGGVVLEVGVLHGDDVAGSLGESRAEGRSLAPVFGVEKLPENRVPEPLLEGLPRAVGGTIVDEDDFPERKRGHGPDPLDDDGERFLFVVDGDDDGEVQGVLAVSLAGGRTWRPTNFHAGRQLSGVGLA